MLKNIEEILKQKSDELRKAMGKLELPNDEKLMPALANAVLVSAHTLSRTKKEVKQKSLTTMGEQARKYYRAGDSALAIDPKIIKQLKALDIECTIQRLDRDGYVLKCWGQKALPGIPADLDKEEEPCNKARALLLGAIKSLEKSHEISIEEFRDIYPKTMKDRENTGKFTVFNLKGDLRAETLEEKIKPKEYRIKTAVWWPAFQAMEKKSATWRYGVGEFSLPGTEARGLFCLTDGVRLAVGIAE